MEDKISWNLGQPPITTEGRMLFAKFKDIKCVLIFLEGCWNYFYFGRRPAEKIKDWTNIKWQDDEELLIKSPSSEVGEEQRIAISFASWASENGINKWTGVDTWSKSFSPEYFEPCTGKELFDLFIQETKTSLPTNDQKEQTTKAE